MHKALFLDRDGIINRDIAYLYRIADVEWVDGIFELTAAAVRLGYKLVTVTNQAGIGRGLYTEADFHILMDWMREQFAARQTPLDAVYFSPWHPIHAQGDYKREHPDRKPGPGMILRAAQDLNLDLTQSILVGDRCSDIAAANAANLRQAFLLTGTEPTPCPGTYLPITTLAELQSWLEHQ